LVGGRLEEQMRHERLGDRIFVRLDRGEELLVALTRFCKDQGIGCASLTGIGAVEDSVLGYYDLGLFTYLNKTIPGVCELVSLTGNVTLVDGEPFIHAHACLGRRDLTILGGHLVQATVAVTAEVFLDPCEGSLERVLDPEVKLKLIE
jgi:uncharacterized protein